MKDIGFPGKSLKLNRTPFAPHPPGAGLAQASDFITIQ
jgi:hypothetical protein